MFRRRLNVIHSHEASDCLHVLQVFVKYYFTKERFPHGMSDLSIMARKPVAQEHFLPWGGKCRKFGRYI